MAHPGTKSFRARVLGEDVGKSAVLAWLPNFAAEWEQVCAL